MSYFTKHHKLAYPCKKGDVRQCAGLIKNVAQFIVFSQTTVFNQNTGNVKDKMKHT